MKNNFIMPFTESNITLNFPDHNDFCFENCAAYQSISAFKIKEMDAGWFDMENKILYLIELKDFSQVNTADDKDTLSEEDKAKAKENTLLARANNLVKKAADSTAMMKAILLNTTWGQLLQNNLPCPFDNTYKIWPIAVIHNSNQNETVNTSLLNDKFNDFFKGYREIFNISYAAVLSHEKAKQQFPFFI